MTDTLTNDPPPADAPELNEDEQNSLEVAEKLGEEEAKQYAGKFENAEELEKAYIELQKKLGDDKDTAESEAEAETDTEAKDEKEEEEVSPGVALITEASEEYFSNEGKLSEETMAKFSEMSSKDLVSAYMEMQANNPTPQTQTETKDLSDAEVNTIQNSVGGEKAYQQMIDWAGSNMDQDKLNAFNTIINSGGMDAVQLAVNGLKAEYENAEGYEGRMLTGKAAKSSGDVYRSQQEVVRAMADPKYDNDPAYRQDVYDKLERSNVQF